MTERSPPRRPGEPEQNLVPPVLVEPIHQTAPMIVSASSCRDGNESHLEPGDGHLETGTVKDLDDLVEVVQPGQRKLASGRAVPRRHQPAPGVDPHHREVRRPRLERGKRRRGVRRQIVQQVQNLVAKRGVELGSSCGRRDSCLERERTLAGEPASVVDRPDAAS